MNSRLSVTDTELAVGVYSPTPRDTFLVNGHADRVAKTYIFDFVGDRQNFLREWVLAKNAASPEEELTFIVDTSRLVGRINLDNVPELQGLDIHRCLRAVNLIANTKL